MTKRVEGEIDSRKRAKKTEMKRRVERKGERE
jgi:hypothetical protein